MTTTVAPELALVPIDTTSPRRASAASDSRSPSGPGWWDSSWDLLRGLEVREERWNWERGCAETLSGRR
jgi:hypothetical protein